MEPIRDLYNIVEVGETVWVVQNKYLAQPCHCNGVKIEENLWKPHSANPFILEKVWVGKNGHINFILQSKYSDGIKYIGTLPLDKRFLVLLKSREDTIQECEKRNKKK